MHKEVPDVDYLFECSWEVCNKVGGIYTVIKSKAALMNKIYDNYFAVGPYFENHANFELEQEEPPEFLRKAFAKLASKGIKCYFGTWQIQGEPYTILIDGKALFSQKNQMKKELWDDFRVDTIASGYEFEEPMVWSWAVGELIEEIKKVLPDEKIVGHFHEWLAGISLLYLKMKNVQVGTVFTTHATMLGRSLCGSGYDLYANLENINPYNEAKRVGVMDKFSTERACAHNASVFTTVSEITGIEAEKLLGKKPDVLVLNGLDLSKFPTFEDASYKHIKFRSRIREFLSYYFFPYYNFDLNHNLIFSIFGRYEYKNKGIDIFIKSLAQLNRKLKEKNALRTIAAFFFIPTGIRRINTELLKNKIYYRHLKDYIIRHSDKIEKSILRNLISGNNLTQHKLFSKEFLSNNKKHLAMFRKTGIPPLSTHELSDESRDPIMNEFKRSGLLNRPEDKVKVILYPVYLNGVDGLLDIDYYNVISGSHLGVFPSYYEPWGYTPLETAALGVPAITTDFAGFGRFIKQDDRVDKSGIFVLKRQNRSDNDVIKDFSNLLYNFSRLTKHERVKQKIDAKSLTELADWKILVYNYVRAHNLAVEKVYG